MNHLHQSGDFDSPRDERHFLGVRPGLGALSLGLILLFAAGLLGAGLPPEAASAQGEPTPPPAPEALLSHLAFDGVLNVPRLPSSSGASGAAPTQPAPQYAPWSRLVFQSVRNDHDWEVYTARGDGSEQANLSNHQSMDVHPRLDRGATRVAFASNRQGNYDVFRMNADGTSQTRLTGNTANDVYPAWSPDASRIAFQSYRDGQAEIYVMNADGSGQTRLTDHDDYDGEPAWAPDGSKIAFTRRESGRYRIWVMNADGGNPQQLSNQGSSEYPAWSPDGSQIAYDADGDGDGWQEIWLMDATGGNQRQVYEPPESNTDAWVRSWSPDGRYVAFTRISWTQYQGDWYWTTAYLDAWDTRDTWNVIRLSSNGNDWHPDLQTADIQAPNSTVLQLPANSRVAGFEVRWEGNDSGPAGLASYDVQYRVGATGAWTPWLSETSATSAAFAAIGGQTVGFRVRARDAAGNLEAWPAADAADASTAFYTWQLVGRLTDNRGVAIGGAVVNITPPPLFPTQTKADGDYLAYLTASGDHSLTVDRAGYGPLAVPALTIDRDRRLDLYLPPAQDLVTNGGFEAGAPLPADWTFEGPEDAVAVSADAHAGERALLLGRACPYPCLSESELIEMWANSNPDIASDSQGHVYLFWAGYESGYPVARLAVRSPGGTWSTPESLGLRSASDYQVGIAVDGHDVVHIVWPGSDGLYYRSRAPGAEWSMEQRLVQGGETLDIAADHLGGVHVVYYAWEAASGTRGVRYLERLPSGTWRSPVVLDSGGGYRWPGVAVGPDASVHFIYQEIQLTGDPSSVFYRWRPYGESILPAQQLWRDNGYSFFRQNLAVGSDSTVHATFHWGHDSYYATRRPGGLWTTPEPMGGTGSLAIAVDSLGTLHAAGLSGYGPYSLYYRSRSSDGSWRAPVTLGDSNNDGAAVTVEPLGTVHLANFLMSPQQGLYYWTSLNSQDAYTVTAGQEVTIPSGMHRPTLSANFASLGGVLPLSIRVTTDVSTTEVFSATATAAWQLAHADLSSWAGQPVTITFMLRQIPDEAYTQIRIDDVTLGEWPTPVIASVDPSRADAWTATPIVVHGMNLIATPVVRVGSVQAEDVTWVDEETLQATVPATLGPGTYDLWVTNPGGAATLLAGAFRSGRPTFLPLIRR